MVEEDRRTFESGVKRQKKSKFGRAELRSVTRTTKRKIPLKQYTRDDESDNGNENLIASEEEDDEEGGEFGDDNEIEKKVNIASKRSHKGENKMAYSALVTLLKSEHDVDELHVDGDDEDIEDIEKQDDATDSNEDEDDDDDHGKEDNTGSFRDVQEEILDDDEKEQDDIDVLNKFDAFNLHFNQEDEISKIIDKYESLPVKERKLRLFNKQEISIDEKISDDDDDDDDDKVDEKDEKYIKYQYGYPQVNEKLIEGNSNSGRNLERKLKYHNVKGKVTEKFDNLKNIDELDIDLIESMLTYKTLNFQYLNNENIKSKYQDYYILHIMNHLMKTRDRILNNNEKKHMHEKKMKEGGGDRVGEEEEKEREEPEFRDQGYTRPKILILLPSRNFAYKLVNKLIKHLEMENVENKKKFKTQFYDSTKISDRVYHSRPKDFEEYFDGNTNDMFVLGIKYTRKTLKLYSPLEQSDIIIASPIGLLKLYDKINSKYSKKNNNNNNSKDTDKHNGNEGMKNNFLSSIEICILDKAEGMMMQNWTNVTDLLTKHLNQTPKDFINVDFSRIRMWAINGQSEYITQILCFNKYSTPEMISIIKRSKNLLSGSISYIPINSNNIIDSFNYKMYQLGLINKFERLKQVFTKFDFDINSIVNEPEKRFEFFKNVILPQIINKSSYKFGTLIYIPNYFDYLRIKKYLKDESNISFVAIDEYSNNSKLTRNRALFQNRSNLATIMLYTERLHFYKRFDIKGVRNIIFYQLPSDPDFYQQVLEFISNEKLRIAMEMDNINKLQKQNKEEGSSDDDDDNDDDNDLVDLNLCMVRSIYSKLDAMRFGPIVGSKNVGKLSNSETEITEFS
jgi:U3 small nucleolar RNA-associated protein 25